MSVTSHSVNLGDYTMHIKDAVKCGGKLIIRFSDNYITEQTGVVCLLQEEYDVTPSFYRSNAKRC